MSLGNLSTDVGEPRTEPEVECFSLHAFGLVKWQTRGAESGVRSVENVESRKYGVWKMRSVENVECGKCGVWKMGSVENAES